MHSFYIVVSSREQPGTMANISLLLTEFFVVGFFIAKVRGRLLYVTQITRTSDDVFTNAFCGNCSEYGAKYLSEHVCQCEFVPPFVSDASSSMFLRSERKCKSGKELRSGGGCLLWDNHEDVEVIDVHKVNSTKIFARGIGYVSCELIHQFISFLDAEGKWEPFNLSANVLQVINGGQLSITSTIKVTQKSSSFTNLSGHVMKLDLNCTRRNGGTDVKCLVFKAKGHLNFPLCNYTVPATTVSTTAVSTQIITVTPSTTTVTPSTTTVTPSTTTVSSPPTTTPAPPNPGIIAAISTIGTVLCLALIGAFVFLCYHYVGRSRNRQAREFNDFAVISNPGQQTYRVQNEPLYVELPDVCPSNMQNACDSAEISEGKWTAEPSVLLNPYASGASFSRGRISRDPLPSRPDEETTRTENIAGHVCQNNRHEEDELRDVSIVLKNPDVQETLSRSLPRSRGDFPDLPEAHEQEELELGHQHHHHHRDVVDAGTEEDLDYQGLVKGKRVRSMFVCPSCNENPDYQTLSGSGHCPHERQEKRRQKSASFYESLALERRSRESVYASPSHVGQESALEDEGNENVKGMPEYNTLEPEDTEQNQEVDEPVTHDYNVLEKPEQTCSEMDEDNNKVSNPLTTEEDPEVLPEPPGFVNIEENPAYAVPWKKSDSEAPARKRSYSM